jgi:hypothetical protein
MPDDAYEKRDFHERGIGEDAVAILDPIKRFIDTLCDNKTEEQDEHGTVTEDIQLTGTYDEQDSDQFFNDLLHRFQEPTPPSSGALTRTRTEHTQFIYMQLRPTLR